MKRFLLISASLAGLAALLVSRASAQVSTYTNVSDYDAAAGAAGYTVVDSNFDSIPSGTLIPSGNTVQGITFTYPPTDFGGFTLQVDSGFDTTSSPNYLGTTGDGSFLSGDEFTMTFAQPEEGIGLFVISGGYNIAGDYTLSVAQGSALSSGTTDSTYGTLGDGGNVYFLGLMEDNPGNTFTTATFTSVDGGYGIPFNVDDISVLQTGGAQTVPDGAAAWSLLIGALAVLACVSPKLRAPCGRG